jgi:hypothetical protein
VSREPDYSALDRALHRLAFGSRALQEIAVDLEDRLFANRFRHIPVESPIFVTSLPRAGTTLMLEVLARVPNIATHTYRDMPFVVAPLLWDALSRGFRRPSALRERAHGDGMAIGYDSPEAFEEIVWRMFWSGKYQIDRIGLWSEEESAPGFHETFLDHIRKIISLRTGHTPGARYASKNNANIARITLLRRLFPDCIILVPVRDPVGQGLSLLEQHRRFTALHRDEPFVKQYMSDIGHYEFGELHRPIDFDGVDEMRRRYQPDTLDYWVAYWECACRHLLQHRASIATVSYEALCAGGSGMMPALAERLSLPEGALREAVGDRMRAPRDYGAHASIADPDLERRVRLLHRELLESSVIPVASRL